MKKVIRYSEQGDYLCSYDSLTDAAQAVSVTKEAVRQAVSRGTVCKGSLWRYAEADGMYPSALSPAGKKRKGWRKRVVRYDRYGSYLAWYGSLSAAASAVGLSEAALSQSIRRKGICAGSIWMFTDSDEDSPEIQDVPLTEEQVKAYRTPRNAAGGYLVSIYRRRSGETRQAYLRRMQSDWMSQHAEPHFLQGSLPQIAYQIGAAVYSVRKSLKTRTPVAGDDGAGSVTYYLISRLDSASDAEYLRSRYPEIWTPDDVPADELPKRVPRKRRMVGQYNLSGQLIHVWKGGVREIADRGANTDSVRSALCGRRQTAHGFIWRYIDELEE